jgi:hypothetical protein
MPLLTILDPTAHAALPDPLKALYVENATDKQFYIDITPDEAGKIAVNLQAEKTRLVTNNAELLKQKGEANEKLKKYTDLGKTPDEVSEFLKSKRPEDVQQLITQHEQEKARLKDSYDQGLADEKAKLASLGVQLQTTLAGAAIAKLRNEHGLNDVADFILKEFIQAVPNDQGEYEIKVVENGQPKLLAGGQEMTPAQLIKDFQDSKKYLSMFNGGTGGGSGDNKRQEPVGYKGTIRADDQQALENNIEGLANGTVRAV